MVSYQIRLSLTFCFKLLDKETVNVGSAYMSVWWLHYQYPTWVERMLGYGTRVMLYNQGKDQD